MDTFFVGFGVVLRPTLFFWHHGARLHHFKINIYFLLNKNNLFSPWIFHFNLKYGWNCQIWMNKCMNLIEKCFLVYKMDGWINKMLHKILSDHHPRTFSKTKKGLLETLLGPIGQHTLQIRNKFILCSKNVSSIALPISHICL